MLNICVHGGQNIAESAWDKPEQKHFRSTIVTRACAAAVSFATAPAMSPVPSTPAAAPAVSVTTATTTPVLPAVTATTVTPAAVQTPVLSAVTQPIQDREAQVVAAATPMVSNVQSQVCPPLSD